ncbi:hypothetical protein L6164_023136 [Bauhinia variegata]|uniref:Uncharacterized protein n=1 Tax=Bauhinia variegata TaxID=167791 RepID=A0ACB9MJ74_BAUVA|nr:hypothetical protein L6164_023136 [Bauhinia variegata]
MFSPDSRGQRQLPIDLVWPTLKHGGNTNPDHPILFPAFFNLLDRPGQQEFQPIEEEGILGFDLRTREPNSLKTLGCVTAPTHGALTLI